MSNRYHLLHVLSKEVVAKWQGIVEEHQNFESKLNETSAWLDKLDGAIDAAVSEDNPDTREDKLRAIIAEQEHAPVKVNNVASLGERLFGDTSGAGREVVRESVRKLRQKWDDVLGRAEQLQKKQDAQAQAWQAYKESLEHANSWLATAEGQQQHAGGGTTPDQMNWLSLQETRSRLLKLKADLAEAAAHKRVVEAVNERGAAAVRAGANAKTVAEESDAVVTRYAALIERMKANAAAVEDSVDGIQQYQDLLKSHQDRMKQLWARLQVHTDYSGSKAGVESRLKKVNKLKGELTEGKNEIEGLSRHVAAICEEKKLPDRAKEAMERDLANVK